MRLKLILLFLMSAIGCAPIDPPTIRPFPNMNEHLLVDPLRYQIKDTESVVIVPAGFVTDLASVPRPLWSFLAPYGVHGRAAIIHDYLYWDQSCTRLQADKLFLLALVETEVSDTDRSLLYWAVRVFGQNSWDQNAAERRQRLPRVIPVEFRRITAKQNWPTYRDYLIQQGIQADPIPEKKQPPPYCNAADAYLIEPLPQPVERPEYE